MEQGEGLDELKEDYRKIVAFLDEATRNGKISAVTRKAIFEMSNKVLEKIAAKYDKVMEGVKSVMGGRVLEYEAKTIFNEGRVEGRAEGIKEVAINLYKNGIEIPTIAAATGVSVDIIRKWLGIQITT